MKGKVDQANPLVEAFSLYNLDDYDSHYPRHAWQVGIKTDFPPILRKRLVASVVATQMGGASVDYVLKRYLNDDDVEAPPTKGQEINHFIKKSHKDLHNLVDRLTHHDDDNVGRVMAELTMMRQEYTTTCFLFLANRGAIFEGYSLLRMQMEQFAWILAVDRIDDPEKVQKVRAQSSIRRLDDVVPGSARIYGHLSAYAHWSYDAHVRAITSDAGRLGVLFASVQHKAELLAYGTFFTGLFAKIVSILRRKELLALEDGQASLDQLEKINSDAQEFARQTFDMLDAAHDNQN